MNRLDRIKNVNEDYRQAISAVCRGDKAGLEVFLAKGMKDMVDEDGWSLMMWAAHKGETESLRLLIEAGADPLLKTHEGTTALMFAAWDGWAKAVETLLPISEVDSKDNEGWTALMLAAGSRHENVVDILLPESAIDERNDEGKTAEDIARQSNYRGLAEKIRGYAVSKIERNEFEGVAHEGSRKRGRRL